MFAQTRKSIYWTKMLKSTERKSVTMRKYLNRQKVIFLIILNFFLARNSKWIFWQELNIFSVSLAAIWVFMNWDAGIHGPLNRSVFSNCAAGIHGPSNWSAFSNYDAGIHGPQNRSVFINWDARSHDVRWPLERALVKRSKVLIWDYFHFIYVPSKIFPISIFLLVFSTDFPIFI